MKKELEELIEKLKEREEYLLNKEEITSNKETKDYYLGKWYEVNRIRTSLEEIIEDEK